MILPSLLLLQWIVWIKVAWVNLGLRKNAFIQVHGITAPMIHPGFFIDRWQWWLVWASLVIWDFLFWQNLVLWHNNGPSSYPSQAFIHPLIVPHNSTAPPPPQPLVTRWGTGEWSLEQSHLTDCIRSCKQAEIPYQCTSHSSAGNLHPFKFARLQEKPRDLRWEGQDLISFGFSLQLFAQCRCKLCEHGPVW